MTVVEALTAARALLLDPRCWHRGAGYATDEHGSVVLPTDSRARRFCPLGAVMRTTAGAPDDLRIACAQALYRALPDGKSLVVFNSRMRTTHVHALSLFDRAIHAEQQRAA